jgi:hypothetical protein
MRSSKRAYRSLTVAVVVLQALCATSAFATQHEIYGPLDRHAVPLIAGTGAQLTSWPVEFYEAVVKRGYRVMAYAIGLLTALGSEKAHIPGASGRATIAQTDPAKNPQRVSSLTTTMNIVLWAVQSFLAGAFLVAGGTKLAKDRTVLLDDPRMAWARDFSSSHIKLIALAEVFGAIALIVPQAFRVLPVVTALAATGLALLMAGAVFTHWRRHESAASALVLLLSSVAVAIGRFAIV